MEGKISGFYVWFIGNILWIIYGFITEQWHVIGVFGFYALTCVRGVYVWNKKAQN